MKNIFLIILLAFPTFALGLGNDQGNGGDGVWIGNKLYVLDLLEAGVEENPVFSSTTPVKANYQTRLDHVFDTSVVPTRLLALKLSEIATVDSVTAESLLYAIEFYTWRWVNSSLVDIYDEDSTLNYPRSHSVQIAVRRGQGIKISREAWGQLDEGNRVALILHEAVYSLIAPKDNIQNSPQAREINGYFFTTDLLKRTRTELQNLTIGFLPYNIYKNDVLTKTHEQYVVFRPSFSLDEKEFPITLSVAEFREKATTYCNTPNRYTHVEVFAAGIQFNFKELKSLSGTYLSFSSPSYTRLNKVELSAGMDKKTCVNKTTDLLVNLSKKTLLQFSN